MTSGIRAVHSKIRAEAFGMDEEEKSGGADPEVPSPDEFMRTKTWDKQRVRS